eukprot:1181921-Prorocentrum_minimum.AAC.3
MVVFILRAQVFIVRHNSSFPHLRSSTISSTAHEMHASHDKGLAPGAITGYRERAKRWNRRVRSRRIPAQAPRMYVPCRRHSTGAADGFRIL